MHEIKIKEILNKNVKTVNKGILRKTFKITKKGLFTTSKIKNGIILAKERVKNSYDYDKDSNEYAIEKVNISKVKLIDKIDIIKKKGNQSVRKTKDNIINTKIKIGSIKTKLSEKGKIRNENTRKNEIKKLRKQSEQNAIKQAIGKRQQIKSMFQRTRNTTTKTMKVTISSIKAIINGMKALIIGMVALGWIVLIVIIIICLIGLFLSSIFGIFFSSSHNESISMNSVIRELNMEMSQKITSIQESQIYDDYKIESNRAEWKDTLSIYSAKVSKGSNEEEILTLDSTKKAELRKIFWDMNEVTYEIKQEDNEIEYEVGSNLMERKKKVLYIKITSKSVDEMMRLYNFNLLQKQQVKELLSEEYSEAWRSVIFGVSSENDVDIIQIALSQVGNIGGQPYWSWYGFSSRVEWCAIFVSWVANESGYLEKGIIPKFSGVINGINWFKAMAQWRERDYVPVSGDIIFFDWEQDGKADHVGFVEKVENNIVYTIEGNSTDDTCRQKEYLINSELIYGYGIPAY